MPIRAALATATREGLIRHNPAQGLSLPPRDQLPSDEIKVFTPEQLPTVIELAPRRHRLLLELLAATGLRYQRGDRPAAPPCATGRPRA